MFKSQKFFFSIVNKPNLLNITRTVNDFAISNMVEIGMLSVYCINYSTSVIMLNTRNSAQEHVIDFFKTNFSNPQLPLALDSLIKNDINAGCLGRCLNIPIYNRKLQKDFYEDIFVLNFSETTEKIEVLIQILY